ncbi:hypothetical protein GBA52_001033 [Prunus armeniaca]|nr:hypothetical protein GBA52_001033 [Prunus armeniaca]
MEKFPSRARLEELDFMQHDVYKNFSIIWGTLIGWMIPTSNCPCAIIKKILLQIPWLPTSSSLQPFSSFSILFYSSTFSLACNTCKPQAPAPAPQPETCPKDTLKLGVCIDLLGLVNLPVGTPPTSKCCALLEGFG